MVWRPHLVGSEHVYEFLNIQRFSYNDAGGDVDQLESVDLPAVGALLDSEAPRFGAAPRTSTAPGKPPGASW